ncbi:MAG: DUF885 domain-containing protein, partial [Bryobacteraceae bacterium]|nr:DUF885 domain-containing protein [Bryobacteraceae bacterium]
MSGYHNSTRLYSLIAADWEFQKRYSPTLADLAQERPQGNQWPDLSEASIRAFRENDRKGLAQVRQIDLRGLSDEARLDHRLFERELLARMDEWDLSAHLTSLGEFGRFGPSALNLLSTIQSERPPSSLAELKQRAIRLQTFPNYVVEQISIMRQAGRLKMYPPRELVQAAVGELATELEKPPAESAFSLSSGNGGKAAQSPEEASLTRAGREALVSRVIPSLRQLHRFLAEEYLPACAVSPSLMAWPNGSRIYGLLLRRSTTTTMTAAEIHRLGLSEVARIQAEMKSTVEKTGFRGTLDQFFAMIRSDERFYCKSPDELLTAYRATAKRIEPAIVKLFRTFPRMPFGVEASRAISGPAATYSRPAIDGSRAGI